MKKIFKDKNQIAKNFFFKKELRIFQKNWQKIKVAIDLVYSRIKKFHTNKNIFFKFKDKYKNELSYKYSAIDKVGVMFPEVQQVIQVLYLWIVYQL